MVVISPFWWLGAVSLGVFAVRFAQGRAAHKAEVVLSAVARGARMNYSALDRFDLATRLQQAIAWTGGVTVSDVIYGAAAGERRFVATVERRATADDRPRRMVVACAENLEDGAFRTYGEPVVLGRGHSLDQSYRDALELLTS